MRWEIYIKIERLKRKRKIIVDPNRGRGMKRDKGRKNGVRQRNQRVKERDKAPSAAAA